MFGQGTFEEQQRVMRAEARFAEHARKVSEAPRGSEAIPLPDGKRVRGEEHSEQADEDVQGDGSDGPGRAQREQEPDAAPATSSSSSSSTPVGDYSRSGGQKRQARKAGGPICLPLVPPAYSHGGGQYNKTEV